MKICISSTSNNKNSLVDKRFGRCPYFAIYDSDTNNFNFIENTAINESQGAGLAASQNIVDEKVDAVITGNVGPNAIEILSAANITMYQYAEDTVEQQVQLFLENKLTAINKPGPSHSGIENHNRKS